MRNGIIVAYVVGAKGQVSWGAKVCEDFELWGYLGDNVFLISDGERSMIALKKAIVGVQEGGNDIGRVGGGGRVAAMKWQSRW